MPYPPEFFQRFHDEHGFLRGFVKPLLHKLGFSVVLDYHGQDEFGKDLVFAEIDRFGHVRYHALQARYTPSIGLTAIEKLTESCRQAFANPFIHPQTGQKEVISSFYGVNAGGITAKARQHFFAAMVPLHHQNARLLDGEELLVLNRWSGAVRAEAVQGRVAGLLNELDLNERLLGRIKEGLAAILDGKATVPPPERVFTASIGLYVSEPFIPAHPRLAEFYALGAARLNKLLDTLQMPLKPVTRRRVAEEAYEELAKLPAQGKAVLSKVEAFIEHIGPVATPDEAAMGWKG